MALPINIEDLLRKQKIEGNRIEFKSGWNPDSIYHSMIKATLDYLRTNLIKEWISKPKDRAESDKFFNYPYQAFEEGVVNAMYHRDYQEREPVEIRIEPDGVSILSYAGPDRSISMESIRNAKSLKARRYRNRRLGDFLKELELSEGRATGIPTIQDELRQNGSAPARIETDELRSYFLLEIPCREDVELGDENDGEPIETTQVSVQVSVQVKSLIMCMNNNELAVNEILSVYKLVHKHTYKSHHYFKKNFIVPAIEGEYVDMSYPNKPTHPHQKYRLTAKGLQLKDLLSKQK